MNVFKIVWYSQCAVNLFAKGLFHCEVEIIFWEPDPRYQMAMRVGMRARWFMLTYRGGIHHHSNPNVIDCHGSNWDRKRGVLFL